MRNIEKLQSSHSWTLEGNAAIKNFNLKWLSDWENGLRICLTWPEDESIYSLELWSYQDLARPADEVFDENLEDLMRSEYPKFLEAMRGDN